MIPTHQRISGPYLEMQRQLHADPSGYGQRGDKWAGIVVHLVLAFDATSVLDYGCGAGALAATLRPRLSTVVRIAEYDPAIPGKDSPPDFADLVVCTDVLEHVEPVLLPNVLAHLKMLARKALWVVVATKGTEKRLADGRNAHLTIQPPRWWKQQFKAAGFTVRPAPTVVRAVPNKEWAVILLP